MGIVSFFVRDWRIYQIALTLPGLIFLTYWWFIPESVRWLLTKNKRRKAVKQIQKIAQSNNVELSQEILSKFIESESQDGEEEKGKASVFDLFRQPHLRMKAILIFMDWFAVSGRVKASEVGTLKSLKWALQGPQSRQSKGLK